MTHLPPLVRAEVEAAIAWAEQHSTLNRFGSKQGARSMTSRLEPPPSPDVRAEAPHGE